MEIHFEKLRSLNQKLTFNYTDIIFKNANISFGDIQRKHLVL